MSLFKTKVIELFGLPRTGKTSSADALLHSLRQDGLRVHVMRERASLCPIGNKLSPLFNYWTALSQMREYVEACDEGFDVVLADRGLLDSAVWLRFKNATGEYAEEWTQFLPLLHNSFMNSQTSVAIWITSDIELVLNREREGRLGGSLGTVVNREVLCGYLKAYGAIKPELERLVPIHELDATGLDLSETLTSVDTIVRTHLAR